MKLLSIRFLNWRSFLGEHSLEFSILEEKPITLVLAPNGAGKTAFLNAFTWALYGKFTAGFDEVTKLVNLDAIELDPKAKTFVELVLEHNKETYVIRRTTDAVLQERQDFELTVTKDGQVGTEADVHRILAEPLKDLFFFPAETFSTASVLRGDDPGEGSSFDIGRAIRALLSGDIYDRASENLRKAIESDALKPPRNFRDETVEEVRRLWEQAQADLNALEERGEKLPSLLVVAREEAARAKKDAERYDPVKIKEWERAYRAKSDSVDRCEELVRQVQNLFVELMRHAHMHFSYLANSSAIERLDLAEKAGLMPPRIHERVLEKTLSLKKCLLCGVSLSETSVDRVKELQRHVNKAQLAIRGLETRTRLQKYSENRVIEIERLKGEVVELAERLQVRAPKLDGFAEIQSALRTCIEFADRALDAATSDFEQFKNQEHIDRPVDGRSPVDIAILRQAKVSELQEELNEFSEKRTKLQRDVDRLFDEYRMKSGKSADYVRKTEAISILKEAKAYFDQARSGLESFGRQDFESAINQTYSDLVAKPYKISVLNDFSIEVLSRAGSQRMPLSQSEKVLLLIAFLGAIARLAPHYEEIARRQSQFKELGNVITSRHQGFPVVLDSPTSPLDEEYEEAVIRALPDLLPQVIIPVSAKSVEKWEAIGESIGKAYVMELTSSDASDRTVRWCGRDYIYSVHDVDTVSARTKVKSIN